MDLEQIRREYLLGGLRRKNLLDNPFSQFQVWLEQALKSNIPDPTACTLATVDSNGMPSQRIVLLKHSDQNGMVFFTNYKGQKAREINQNPQCSLHFPWHVMERQVCLQGVVEKVTQQESLDYFRSRPRESQIAAWASPQSDVIESRDRLEQRYNDFDLQFKDRDIDLPDSWGGYRLKPKHFEFWQGGARRLHDRFRYEFQDGAWHIARLAP